LRLLIASASEAAEIATTGSRSPCWFKEYDWNARCEVVTPEVWFFPPMAGG